MKTVGAAVLMVLWRGAVEVGKAESDKTSSRSGPSSLGKVRRVPER